MPNPFKSDEHKRTRTRRDTIRGFRERKKTLIPPLREDHYEYTECGIKLNILKASGITTGLDFAIVRNLLEGILYTYSINSSTKMQDENKEAEEQGGGGRKTLKGYEGSVVYLLCLAILGVFKGKSEEGGRGAQDAEGLRRNCSASSLSRQTRSLKKQHLNASRPLSVLQSGGKLSKRLGGIIGCKYKISSWHLNGFADGSHLGSTV